jgi:hypothetical protein
VSLHLLTARSSSAAESVSLTLKPAGRTELAQGLPFAFWAVVRNTSGDEERVRVDLILAGPARARKPVPFRRWNVVIPGGETMRLRVEIVPAQWFAETGEFRVLGRLWGRPIGDEIPFQVTKPTVLVPRFQDVTAAAGLDTPLPGSICGEWAAGAAWGDIDADGDLDLYLPVRGEPAHLWINDGTGRFKDESAERGADNGSRRGVGAVFADYDNDRDQDLYVINHGPNRLYRNDGTGRFLDVALAAGVADPGVGPSAAWGDYDGDGHLDLYVVNHTECHFDYQADKLYHNEGDGTFTDRTALLEEEVSTTGAGFQAAWFDYDRDGDDDLYLANDYIGMRPDENHLWRNDGPGRGGTWLFTEVSAEAGVDFAINSMGIALGDYDRDLDLDMAISNIGGNVLARDNGDGTFTEVADYARVSRPMMSANVEAVTWGVAFYDLNLDGWEDLFVAAGEVLDIPPQPDEIFVNDGKGRFLDLSAPSGADDLGSGRGVAFADYDRDGRVDLFVTNQGGVSRLYRNVTSVAGLHWLGVRLRGSVSNRDGCGALLTATVAGTRQLRQVVCGSTSLASGSDLAVHFGLGAFDTVSELLIEWPSGTRQVLRDLPGDRLIEITEAT